MTRGNCLACDGTGVSRCRVLDAWRCEACAGTGNVVPTGAQCSTCDAAVGSACLTRNGMYAKKVHATRAAVTKSMKRTKGRT